MLEKPAPSAITINTRPNWRVVYVFGFATDGKKHIYIYIFGNIENVQPSGECGAVDVFACYLFC